jgi:hypothetical protein
MKRGTTGALLCAALILLAACGDDSRGTPLDGGNCEYVDHLGTATIVSTDPAPAGGNNCLNAVEVVFDFAPNGTSGYIFPQWPDEGNLLTVGDGKNPPATWVAEKGLTPGSEHDAVRREIVIGTCTPVLFEFPDLDLTGWEEDCF